MSEKTHIALPLKYRPMTFADVVGQEHVVKTLRHAIESGRVANAYLFIGPRGIGKTTMSRIFAKALNCMSPDGVEPCGKCTNCEEIASGRSIDVIELDAASHNKVEDVRPIIDAVQFRPATSKYKIFIIDECHMLTVAAWNALLKTLEEPPPWARFVFATTEGDKVLATIISRCQRFDLRRIQTHDIVSRLKYICANEKIDAEDDALLAIARGADGGMRDALSSLDQLVSFKGDKVTEADALGVFGLVSRSALEGLASAILKGDTAEILTKIEMFDSAGKNMRRVVAELIGHFRNLVVLQALGADSSCLEATPDQIAVLKEQAKIVEPGRVFRICDLLSEMEDRLRHVLSVRTLIEMSLIRASRIASTATIEELMRAVRALKSGDDSCLVPRDSSLVNPPSQTSQTSQDGTRQARPSQDGTRQARPSQDETRQARPSQDETGQARPSQDGTRQARPSQTSQTSQDETRQARPSQTSSFDRSAILNDKLINDIITAIPGSQVVDIKENVK